MYWKRKAVIKMEPNYIQLPPLPSDMPTELIEIVWAYAKMDKSEKENFLEFLQENAKSDIGDDEKEKLLQMMEESKSTPSPYLKEFNSLMQELIATLIAQACEMSALIYQKYRIEKNSIREISEAIHVPESTIELMAQYYDKKINQ